MGAYIDLTGQRFSMLTVIERVQSINKNVRWLCKCDCGNFIEADGHCLKDGHIKSCGCLRRKITASRKFVDLTGRRFGRWTVIRRDGHSSNGHVRWYCACDCGNYGYVDSTCLLHGHSYSCGCYQKDRVREALLHDLTGQVFGKLTVMHLAQNKNSKGTKWTCRCECGRIVDIAATSLVNGLSNSCGCVCSRGEELVKQVLMDNNILFERQKSFVGCKDKKPLHFDFWLPEYGVCIEFDGIQHYTDVKCWDREYKLEDRQRRDAIKTKYCEENDIVLLRIPYWEKDNIESILTDWLFLNDDEEANSPDASHP